VTETLTIALAQLNPTVGDVVGNTQMLREARTRATAMGADIVVASELVISGYPPEDLVLRPSFRETVEREVGALAAETADGGPAMLIGAPWVVDGANYNAALLLDGGGCIVNMASTAGLAGHPWTAAYSASKGGVLALTSTLAVEYGKQGVRANAVCPGSVKTAMHDQFVLPEGADVKLLQRIMPLDTFRGPETAAALVAFLASEDAAHINGEKVRVDGGTLA